MPKAKKQQHKTAIYLTLLSLSIKSVKIGIFEESIRVYQISLVAMGCSTAVFWESRLGKHGRISTDIS